MQKRKVRSLSAYNMCILTLCTIFALCGRHLMCAVDQTNYLDVSSHLFCQGAARPLRTGTLRHEMRAVSRGGSRWRDNPRVAPSTGIGLHHITPQSWPAPLRGACNRLYRNRRGLMLGLRFVGWAERPFQCRTMNLEKRGGTGTGANRQLLRIICHLATSSLYWPERESARWPSCSP